MNGKNRLRVGITLGDPAGIGPEITQAALRSGELPHGPDYIVIGKIGSAVPGHPSAETSKAAWAALEEAAQLAQAGEINAIVTGPIHKARMRNIGFNYLGQTEFFAARSGTTNYAMLLTAEPITVALVTTHLPLAEVANALKPDEIFRVGTLLTGYLHRRGIKTPRIAVAGLNPHAGESGLLGKEEVEIIAPAVAQLQSELGNRKPAIFEGPISPDTLFYHLVHRKWDAALCMYHDQGLIPLKLQGFDRGVNVTLGLPYPRTSPDHGTAFEIAGKEIARSDSMIAALKLAVELVGGQK
jgi:4-hydroxythreonine-4-phosphate dehydrogenase